MELKTHMVRIALAQLRMRPPKRQTLGARSHQWRLHPVLSEDEVKRFEDEHRILLPEDYRFFVTEIGDGGAGPAYGVLRLGEFILSGQRFALPRLDVPFHPGRGMAGALPICEHGCAISHWLVISGPERGSIWTDNRANDGGIRLAVVPDPLRILRKRQTFSQWYCSWLDNMLDAAQSG